MKGTVTEIFETAKLGSLAGKVSAYRTPEKADVATVIKSCVGPLWVPLSVKAVRGSFNNEAPGMPTCLSC
ncbi:hypothetical protein RRG08_054645 [Elysia crispata]|uniref:Uncharacterized protein n=1 Tax=Elysia crispata TaxID=231223 RepID=A0AAE1B0M5_9GAST|nr:hypothetical protein RRG08_054645 [Elysia crispata]